MYNSKCWYSNTIGYDEIKRLLEQEIRHNKANVEDVNNGSFQEAMTKIMWGSNQGNDDRAARQLIEHFGRTLATQTLYTLLQNRPRGMRELFQQYIICETFK